MGYAMIKLFEFFRNVFEFFGAILFATCVGILREILVLGPDKVIYKDGWVKRYFNYFLFFCVIGIIIEIYLNG